MQTLQTPKVVENVVRLTPMTADHVPLLISWAERPDLAEFFRHHPPLFQWFNTQIALQAFVGSYMILNNDQIVGIVQPVANNPYARSLGFAALIDVEDYKLRSLISDQSCSTIVNYAFETLNYRRVYCKILSNRKLLIKKLTEYGFTNEGKLRKSCRVNGEEYDEVIMGVLKEEWDGSRNTSTNSS